MPTFFVPPGETSLGLWFERSALDGHSLRCVAYGVHLVVFATCMHHLYRSGLRRESWRRDAFLAAFVVVIFILGTLCISSSAKVLEDFFVNNRDYSPGGPVGWYLTHYNDPVNVMGMVEFIIANFLTDGLLLWRTYMVWDRNVWVILFPIAMFLASTVMSVFAVVRAVSAPESRLNYMTNNTHFTVPYFALSISLNTLLTLLLVGRLLHMGQKLKRSMGPQYCAAYVSVAAMIVESAAPYTVTGLLFIVLNAVRSNGQNLVLAVLSQVMCINHELIVLRVLRGRDASQDTFAKATSTAATLGSAGTRTTLNANARCTKDDLLAMDCTPVSGDGSETGRSRDSLGKLEV